MFFFVILFLYMTPETPNPRPRITLPGDIPPLENELYTLEIEDPEEDTDSPTEDTTSYNPSAHTKSKRTE